MPKLTKTFTVVVALGLLLCSAMPGCYTESEQAANAENTATNSTDNHDEKFLSSTMESVSPDQLMQRFAWQNRPVLVFAGMNDLADEQMQWLSTDPQGLRDRDIVVIEIPAVDDNDATVQVDGQRIGVSPTALRDKFVVGRGFAVLLVGKDTGVKLRSNQPVSRQTLYETIDAMPMRQREMRQSSEADIDS